MHRKGKIKQSSPQVFSLNENRQLTPRSSEEEVDLSTFEFLTH